jgi:hypothetical protein
MDRRIGTTYETQYVHSDLGWTLELSVALKDERPNLQGLRGHPTRSRPELSRGEVGRPELFPISTQKIWPVLGSTSTQWT